MSAKNQAFAKRYNEILASNNQTTRVIVWSSRLVVLTTCELTTRKDVITFRTRLRGALTQKHIDEIYSENDESARTKRVDIIKRKTSSEVNARLWTELPQAVRDIRSDHMRHIQSLVDQSTIRRATPWNKGLTKLTDDRLLASSQNRMGAGNPMYGTTMSEEEKQRKSVLIKSRIASGEWTPHVHNSRTHWDSKFNGRAYRSSWEAMYAMLNPNDEYETLRVMYIGSDGLPHVYITDFINHESRVVTEIKPSTQINSESVELKVRAAEEWCVANDYQFRVLTEEYFIDKIDDIDFSALEIPNKRARLAKLYEASKKNQNR